MAKGRERNYNRMYSKCGTICLNYVLVGTICERWNQRSEHVASEESGGVGTQPSGDGGGEI